MKSKKELNPTVTHKGNSYYLISFWYKGKRFRYSNGKPIGLDLAPNLEEISLRLNKAELLRSAFEIEISKGWRPTPQKREKKKAITLVQLADKTLNRKLNMNFSDAYKTDLIRVNKQWESYCKKEGISDKPVNSLTVEIIRDFVVSCSSSPKSMPNLKRNISSLLKDEAESYGVLLNLKRIKIPKTTQTLHRPIQDVQALLNDIKGFNDKLFICALLTYGLLLRPHREIRCLKRSDFNENFTLLSLNGQRVKSGRNRVLPIPRSIGLELICRYGHLNSWDNIFSHKDKPHHKDFFKGLWTKYKTQSETLQPEQTLYSFRHTGAIRVFEKTGSLQKLQQVMGHSDMKVSLTYLRGLEVKQLDVEDLPEL